MPHKDQVFGRIIQHNMNQSMAKRLIINTYVFVEFNYSNYKKGFNERSGWFNNKNSKTFSRAFLTKELLVYISPFAKQDFAFIAHETMGLGEFFSSTRHIRQFPDIDKFLW